MVKRDDESRMFATVSLGNGVLGEAMRCSRTDERRELGRIYE